MAYVTLLVPQQVLDAPKLGTIQYHPSLLPGTAGRARSTGQSSKAKKRPGSRFLARRGLDEGPILLQKRVAIGSDDTLGSLYFNQLFPIGVDAMMGRSIGCAPARRHG